VGGVDVQGPGKITWVLRANRKLRKVLGERGGNVRKKQGGKRGGEKKKKSAILVGLWIVSDPPRNRGISKRENGNRVGERKWERGRKRAINRWQSFSSQAAHQGLYKRERDPQCRKRSVLRKNGGGVSHR